MAHDLIFGKTDRDWSCGFVPAALLAVSAAKKYQKSKKDKRARITSTPGEARTKLAETLVAKGDAQGLGDIVRMEIQENANKADALGKAGKLPAAERQAFGSFMNKWLTYAVEKNGTYVQEDLLRILQFRAANRRFTERLTVIEKLGKTPPSQPLVKPEESTALVPAGEKSSVWLVALGLGAGLLGLLFGIRKR